MKVATRKAATEQNLSLSFVVDQWPEEVYDAIINVRDWWTGEINGKSVKPGDEFTFRYEDLHTSRQRVVEAVPGKRVVWLVTEANLSFADNPAEWVGTRIVFDIAKKGMKTQLRFTHEGLVPNCDCYGACDEGWTFYIEGSLRKLITTGKGMKA